jgi:hypothetical protein
MDGLIRTQYVHTYIHTYTHTYIHTYIPAGDGYGVLGLEEVGRRAVVDYDALARLPSHALFSLVIV